MGEICFYACQRDLVPIVEAALAANGFAVILPHQRSLDGTTATVVSNGAAAVLIGCPADGPLAEIEIWGAGREQVAGQIAALLADLERRHVGARPRLGALAARWS